MQFQLPANLREQVAVYDPALKAMIAAQKAANGTAKKKSTAPLGLPDDLFPVEVLPTEDQLAIVQRINGKAAAGRFQVGATENYAYLIYHHEKIWLAAWCLTTHDDLLDPEVPYIYGMTVAYKAAASTADSISRISTGHWDRVFNTRDEMTEVKYGRTMFLKRSKLFTLADIQGKDHRPGWVNHLNAWGTHSTDKYSAARTFAQAISTRIPTWSSDIFERVAALKKPVADSIVRYIPNREFSDSILLTVDQINSIMDDTQQKSFDTPYFRREAQRVVEKINALYYDRSIKDLDKIRQPYILWKQQIEVAHSLVAIYGDETPVDYIQKMYEIGRHIRPIYSRTTVAEWLKLHLPIASFVGWFEKHLNETLLEWKLNPEMARRSTDSTGQPTTSFYELNDTLNMMRNLRERQVEVAGLDYAQRENYILKMDRPNRWRLSEFHDHVSTQVWLAGNKNENLPQDLFPAPIKIDHLDSVWTFFQPRDIHQLSHWGQAVRNCVGNASNYREGVKKRSHFIVLAMIDQKPRFTVQLKVRNGVLEVDQIADIGNRRLDDNERASYELTFSLALKIREAQLSPEAEVEA